MNVRKPSPKLIIGVLLALFIGIASYIRIYLPYNYIFVGDWVKFSGNDAYYYMRIVDNLAHNFPHLNSFDPYFIYPGGAGVGHILFFAWLMAGVIWVIGLGSPTQHIIDVVGAYFPVVLAALTIIPVYFIGKQLFNRWAGVIAAALIAIMPGEFLGRSILGYTDHHIAETLFSTIAMLFFILAIKAAGQSQLTFSQLKPPDRAASTKTLVYSLLAGISLGIYLLTWIGGLLFVFIVTVYLITQFIIDHLQHKSTDYLCIIGVTTLLIATIMFAPFSPGGFYLPAMLIALLVPLALSGISRLMAARQLKPIYYPLTLIGVGVVGLAIFYAIAPSLLRTILEQFGIFAPTGPGTTTLEVQPLFSIGIILPWGNFTTGFFLALAVLGIWILIRPLIWLFRHEKPQINAEITLLVVWSLIILAATIGQRRFAYYFAVNVALLTSYLAWQTIWFAGLKNLITEPADVSEKLKEKHAKPKPKRKARPRLTVNHANTALAAIVVFFFVFFFDIPAAITVARGARFAPSDAWMSAMDWMRTNTPDPFGNPDFYYQLYPPPPPEKSYSYPKSAYGVTAWWDYGYWISRIAHRLPTANPSQGAEPIISVTKLFLSREEAPSEEVMRSLDSRYVVIDYLTTISKFWAIVTWAGKLQTEFAEQYYLPTQKVFVAVYYPEYYRSMVVRLYNFDAKAVPAQSPTVISWDEKPGPRGKYKEITSAQPFPSYEEATAYIKSQKSANYRIVGINPFTSPVPLEALNDYKLVYSSNMTVTQANLGPVPEVKIFEYTGKANP